MKSYDRKTKFIFLQKSCLLFINYQKPFLVILRKSRNQLSFVLSLPQAHFLSTRLHSCFSLSFFLSLVCLFHAAALTLFLTPFLSHTPSVSDPFCHMFCLSAHRWPYFSISPCLGNRFYMDALLPTVPNSFLQGLIALPSLHPSNLQYENLLF